MVCLHRAYVDLDSKDERGSMKDLPHGTNYTIRNHEYYIKYFSPTPFYASWYDLKWATWGAATIMNTPEHDGGTGAITVEFIVSDNDWGVVARGWIGHGDIPEEHEGQDVVAPAQTVASLPIQTLNSATS